jgi:lysozyme
MASLRARAAIACMSAIGVGSIAHYEGFRSDAYLPLPPDKWTVGYGSTTWEDGTPVKVGDTITVERAEILLHRTLTQYEDAVKKCAPVPMYQYEFDAYTSLTYNIGTGAFCGSSIARHLREKNYEQACKDILQWDKFKGKPLKGLTKRRHDEYQLCIGAKEPITRDMIR